MTELVDFTLQQHIAHEIYRHQMMQRLPGKERQPNIYYPDYYTDVLI